MTLHPPGGSYRTWYAYWPGAVYKRSTGQTDPGEAVRAAEAMVRGAGKKAQVADAVLTDQEFEGVQRTHFTRKTDARAKERAGKTLEECLDAISAFKAITGLERISAAGPDDCARFQRDALTRPRNWRKQFPKSKKTDETVSPNTVLKWSRMLQAAFDRVNRNAGKKCVRGVVDEAKLLDSNPWTRFPWIEGTDRPIRQFDAAELLSLLDHLEARWPGVPAAALAVKVYLWSCCRKLEVAALKWADHKPVGGEVHFEVVGKHGVERWFRLPEPLYRDLLAHRTGGPFVFAAYTDQIRRVHAGNAGCLRKIRADFAPENFGRWVYERVKDRATETGRAAYLHVFRKTGLQHAHDAEDADASRKVAADAGVSEAVLLGHYVRPQLRNQSNRTFRRLVAGLPAEVARRYGYVEDETARLERELEAARTAGNWERVAGIAARLGHQAGNEPKTE